MAGLQRVKYQTDAGSIFNVILDDASGVDTFIGTIPSGAYTENMTVRVSKNNKEVGIQPRMILLARTVGTENSTTNCLVDYATRYKRIPIPTKTRWDAITDNSTHTLGGVQYKVKKKLAEKIS